MQDKTFEGVADTLYIPLTARIYVSKRFPEYFFDPKSLELEPAIPGDSIQKGSNEYTMIASCARYHNLDQMANAYAAAHPVCNIVNVGCGLETMFWRIGPDTPSARFYEMDLPEVIEVRRRILGASERDELIAGDAFDLDGIRAAVEGDGRLVVKTAKGSVPLRTSLSDRERHIILCGGLLASL